MNFSTSGERALRLRVGGLIAIGIGCRLDDMRREGRGFLVSSFTRRRVSMDFFEVICGTGLLSFSIFPVRFPRLLTETRFSDERRALGEYCLLLTEFQIPLGLILEGVFLPLSTFMSEVLE